MKSMTGYGRSLLEEDGRSITVEVRSVNHRFLDLALRLPRDMGFLEEPARRITGECLSRGHVDLQVSYDNHRMDARKVTADLSLAAAYQKALNELRASLHREDVTTLYDMAVLPGVMTVTQTDEDQAAVTALFERALEDALSRLVTMRSEEGCRLKEDLLSKVSDLEAIQRQLLDLAPRVVSEYRDKLSSRISSLLSGDMDEVRFNMEVALFADRSAIDEELVRLASHLEAVRQACESTQSVGRKLDFLVQEMNREANTIASKSTDLRVSALAVEAKTIIEKLREQVQNVE